MRREISRKCVGVWELFWRLFGGGSFALISLAGEITADDFLQILCENTNNFVMVNAFTKIKLIKYLTH